MQAAQKPAPASRDSARPLGFRKSWTWQTVSNDPRCKRCLFDDVVAEQIPGIFDEDRLGPGRVGLFEQQCFSGACDPLGYYREAGRGHEIRSVFDVLEDR